MLEEVAEDKNYMEKIFTWKNYYKDIQINH